MIFKEMKEHEDGSATYLVETTKEEREFLIAFAIKEILEKQITKEELQICQG